MFCLSTQPPEAAQYIRRYFCEQHSKVPMCTEQLSPSALHVEDTHLALALHMPEQPLRGVLVDAEVVISEETRAAGGADVCVCVCDVWWPFGPCAGCSTSKAWLPMRF